MKKKLSQSSFVALGVYFGCMTLSGDVSASDQCCFIKSKTETCMDVGEETTCKAWLHHIKLAYPKKTYLQSSLKNGQCPVACDVKKGNGKKDYWPAMVMWKNQGSDPKTKPTTWMG